MEYPTIKTVSQCWYEGGLGSHTDRRDTNIDLFFLFLNFILQTVVAYLSWTHPTRKSLLNRLLLKMEMLNAIGFLK